MKTYSCIILDDDEIDRLIVTAQVKNHPFLHLLTTFSDSQKCLDFCEKNAVDILFLDIEIPNLNGLEIRKRLLVYVVKRIWTFH